jgi:F-actin capping protein alpha subunit
LQEIYETVIQTASSSLHTYSKATMEVDPAQDAAVTEAEKLSIANHLLKSSPPGQFNDVLEDVRMLVPSSMLTADRIASVAKAYNADTARVIKNGDHSFVLAREGEVDSTHYIDTVIGKVRVLPADIYMCSVHL